MSAEENKALILHWLEVEQREGREALLAMHDPACSFPDLAFYGLPPTLDGYKQFLAAASAFSDFSYSVEVIVAEGDTVMVWGTEHSTHTGRWRNIPATNKHVSYRVVACYRLAHGKLIEHRLLIDSLSFLQQVGAIPSSGQVALEKASNALLFCERYLGSVRASEEWVYKTRIAQSLDVLA